MNKSNPSREQLSKSQTRRIGSLMVRTLQRFEDTFPSFANSREGKIYKGDLKGMFNDVIRAARDELTDYVVEYRPLRLTENNTLIMSRTFLQTAKVIDFSFTANGEPSITFRASQDKLPILEAMRTEFGTGVVFNLANEDSAVLQIVGTEACVNCVLSVMDKYRVHQDLRDKYREWRQAVVERYRS